jgi:hypothetical protein
LSPDQKQHFNEKSFSWKQKISHANNIIMRNIEFKHNQTNGWRSTRKIPLRALGFVVGQYGYKPRTN